ncbi:MAG: 4Fe-4S dicluster domain-containing protein [Theionarchaea archaeon]|nr:4Fe-4S dicluster domain-containing protein [Theionarchaea archaeon]MBU7038024.1 4Fe-4S dicluster domain-containing protein [Theionarchaea archaeon]
MTPELKGKIAIVECVEDIPCDPCVTACPSDALVKDSLVGRPQLIVEKCGGCGACIAECPGLAVFVVDFDYSQDKALVMLPYEFIPLPEKGERVDLLDREGTPCGKGEIERVRVHKNKTAVLSVLVPRDLAMKVRNVRRIQ